MNKFRTSMKMTKILRRWKNLNPFRYRKHLRLNLADYPSNTSRFRLPSVISFLYLIYRRRRNPNVQCNWLLINSAKVKKVQLLKAKKGKKILKVLELYQIVLEHRQRYRS